MIDTIQWTSNWDYCKSVKYIQYPLHKAKVYEAMPLHAECLELALMYQKCTTDNAAKRGISLCLASSHTLLSIN